MERCTILVLSRAGEKASCDVKSDNRWQDECHQEAKQNQKNHFCVGGERQASPAACMESMQHGGRARDGRPFIISVLADPLGPAPATSKARAAGYVRLSPIQDSESCWGPLTDANFVLRGAEDPLTAFGK